MEKPIEIWGTGGPCDDVVRYHDGPIQLKTPFYTPESKIVQQAKNAIDTFYAEGKWDDYKKITNPYEYIFLSWNRRTSRSVAINQPLSRSYFKMIELWDILNLDMLITKLVERDGGLITAHAAEGPGGFIEASVKRAKNNTWCMKYSTAITLRSNQRHVPGWRKANEFLSQNPMIEISDGADGTGDILKKENRNVFCNRVFEKSPNGAHIYTADGGFDFSSNFNAQEDNILPLLYSEAILGLRVLTKGGVMIMKCFDCTEQSTISLLWMLSNCFFKWGLVKPCTSRAGNAERYFIGLGFLGTIDDIIQALEQYVEKGQYDRPVFEQPQTERYKIFLNLLYDFQCKIEHLEINVIQETLDLIKKTEPDVIRRLVRENVLRSIYWCEKHNEPVATFWLSDLERNVNKEYNDLIQILQSPTTPTFSFHLVRQQSTISFAGFREGGLQNQLINNPFERKNKPFSR